jgi:phenylacetate-CoA ligase
MKRSATTALIADVLFPLHELLKGHDTVARRRALEESQWWQAEVLERYRLAALKRFLAEIRRRVPFYRQMFSEHGFRPSAMACLSDLAQLPLLSKALIREHLEDLKWRRPALKRSNTGGSSGEPLIFFVGSSRRSHDVAAKWRATRWWGRHR